MEAGILNLKLNDVDLPELIKNVVDQLQVLAESKNQHLQVIWLQQNFHVKADEDRLSRILTNLLDNAMKFTPTNGTIRVAVDRRNEDTVTLTVQDSGPGIPSEALPHLFEPFFQVSDHQKSESGGLGLGLSIVKTLVDLHHGSITVDSELGKGTKFTISLPSNPTEKSAV